MRSDGTRPSQLTDLVLLGVALVWGSSYLVAKDLTVVAPVLVVLATLAVAASAAAVDPPKPKGQQVHLFEATVRVPDRSSDDLEEYNFRLLAEVLGRSPLGSLTSPNHHSKINPVP